MPSKAKPSEALNAPGQARAVQIEKLVYGGDGLGRIDGQVVLAPYVLPGEQVSMAVARAQTGLLRGRSLEIVEASAHRVEPRCEYFGTCGGCQYQHSDYGFQIAQKIAILQETLRRVGGLSYEAEIPAITGHPWFYRNRIQLHFKEDQVGFHKPGSHDLCAVDHCYIASHLLVEAIGRIRDSVRRPQWPKFLRSLELFTNDAELQMNVLDSTRPVAARFFEWCRSFLPSLLPGALEYPAANHSFRISGGSFFQVNRYLMEALVNEVIAGTSGEVGLDLYAGVGLFSLPLATRLQRVYAVERGKSASRDLEHNAQASEGRIQVVRNSAERFLSSYQGQRIDVLVVDPPRAGLGPEMTDAIVSARAERLKIISCDPATLARDLPKMLATYEIERLALVDLFPQTYHFETVAHLRRK
jgi:23S rRNA (uracil1939-C5)-methyltransferase